MPDRHFELPAHPDLEYYRKQAKHLQRTYATGDAAAQARVADVLGGRAAERFLLSDAQFVLAQEHGFRTWAELSLVIAPTRDPRPRHPGQPGARVPNGRSPSIDRTTGAGPPRAATCNKWRGAHRRMIEPTIALLHWFRRLRIRWRSATTSARPS